jgi:hypothetical protein
VTPVGRQFNTIGLADRPIEWVLVALTLVGSNPWGRGGRAVGVRTGT